MYAPSTVKYMSWVIYTGQVTISVLWNHWCTDHLMLYISHMVSINPITFISPCSQEKYTSMLTDKCYFGSFRCVNTATVCKLRNKINWYMRFVIQLGQIHYNDVIMGKMASQIASLTIVYSTVYLSADLRKYQSSAPLAFAQGIHRGPVNSPHKWPLTRRIFHLMTSSWYIRYYGDTVVSLSHRLDMNCHFWPTKHKSWTIVGPMTGVRHTILR